MKIKKGWIMLILVAIAMAAYGVMDLRQSSSHSPTQGEHASAVEEFERGPHRGRLLKQDNFAVEITIYEDHVPPEFHVYVYEKGTPVSPKEVPLKITLSRLDGEVTPFKFVPEGDYLKSLGSVAEPHSFDVKVEATYHGKPYRWDYPSYEGRTTIESGAAEAAGIRTEVAGSALIRESIPLTGKIVLNGNTTAKVNARFPGIVRDVKVDLGQSVRKGDTLAIVESNDSLQNYQVLSPINGVILSRNTNVGDVTGDHPLFIIANMSAVWAEFNVFPRDLARIHFGQTVRISTLEGGIETTGVISALLPILDAMTQTVVARVSIRNPLKLWRVGMTVQGQVTVSARKVHLAVKKSALQRFRDFTVAFAKVGETYEVRMLELGTQNEEWVEVLKGIKPGTPYVSQNSFLIKADLEKSGASHDH